MFIQTEQTPNPSTLKFLPGRVVMEKGTMDFATAEAAVPSPLAKRLFAVEGVERVFFGSDFVTVTKAADRDWQVLKPSILGGIMEHYTSGDPVVADTAEAGAAAAVHAIANARDMRAPLLAITRTSSTSAGVPFEFSHDLFRADRTCVTFRTRADRAEIIRRETGVADASIAKNGPAGMRATTATRSRYGGLNEASHCASAKADTMTAATTPPAAATRRRSMVRSRSPVPTTPSATPNGTNAASEWKYEPRVECRVNTTLSTRYRTTSSAANARTSARVARATIPRVTPGSSSRPKAKAKVTKFVTSAAGLGASS